MFGFRFPENFNYPYSADLDPGFLAALAHDAVGLVSRLCLHSARRQPRRLLADRAQSLDRVLAVRRVARRELEFHHLGHVARPVPVDRTHRRRRRTLDRVPVVLRNIYVLVVVLVGWVFFRSLTLDQALDMLTRMFGLQQGAETMLSLSSNVAAPTMTLIVVASLLRIRSGRHAGRAGADDGRAGRSRLRMASSGRASSARSRCFASRPWRSIRTTLSSISGSEP